MWGFWSVKRPTEEGPATLISFTFEELNKYTDEFDPSNFLGRGGFGSVYGGTIHGREEKNLNGMLVAVKVSCNADNKFRNQWQAEKKFLSVIKHSNIIKLVGHCETTEKYYLVYPLMQNGNVMSKLQDLDWRRTLKIIIGAARAVEELHNQSPPLIYRDLKLENLLLNKDFVPKLSDFGTVTPEGEYLKLGTLGNTDPLILNGGEVGSKPNDIYSLGVVILQMIMKKTQVRYAGCALRMHINDWARSDRSTKEHAVHEKLRRTGCSIRDAKAITELGLECVSDKTLERPTIDQVLERLGNLDGVNNESFLFRFLRRFV